jgi:hypothetical protein
MEDTMEVVKAHVILPLISRRLSLQFGRGILPAYSIFMRGRILLPDIRLVLLSSALLAASSWHTSLLVMSP